MFVLCSDITIGNFRFSGVHEVRVQRSIHSYADRATIKIPSLCRVLEGKRSAPVVLTTADQFADGEEVTINLGYNDTTPLSGKKTPIVKGGTRNTRCTVFRGFVKRRNRGYPLEVVCEGYVRQMRHMTPENGFYAETSAKELLGLIAKKCPDIKVVVAQDLPLQNITLNEATGTDICDKIKELSQGVLSIFFIDPTTLWCGITYTPYVENTDPWDIGTVKYRLGYNVVQDNGLKERDTSGEPVTVIINGQLATGQHITTASQTKAQGRRIKHLVNNIGDEKTLQVIAKEKQYQMNYTGFEGHINGFLEPWCEPGYKVVVKDSRYPEREGTYMVEGTEVMYGLRGARIKVDVGPKIGFKP